ncbi:MAG: response regulator transcription factor [Actinomycetota bacterium]
MARLLLVEDDERVAGAVREALERHGYDVQRAATGAEALAADRVDLVLLDLGLPDLDGLEVCRRLRQAHDWPVIAVTARGSPVERVAGLRGGADDYVVKPFSIAELTARIDAVLRRTGLPTERTGTIELGRVRIDEVGRTVTVDGEPVQLSRKEFDLLLDLAHHRGVVRSRTQLLADVWDTDFDSRSRTVDVHIGVLRHKLDVPGLIETVHGVGYRLTA